MPVAKAPKLYGIDPNVKYYWSPSEFVRRPKVECDELEALRLQIESEYNGKTLTAEDRKSIDKRVDEIKRRYADLPDVIPEDAPALIVAPLQEKYSIRLQHAKSSYDRKLFLARDRLHREIEVVRKRKDIDKNAQDRLIEVLENQTKDKFTDSAYNVYDADLVFDILSDCIKGWRNIVVEFTGDWSKDARVLPGDWKHECFLAILEGNAFSFTEIESFTSRPESASV